jgi:hypothetical protein
MLSVQHLVAGNGEGSGPPQPQSEQAPWPHPTSRAGRASPRVRRGLWPKPGQMGHGPKASPVACEKNLSYFLNKFKILQTSIFSHDSF